MKPNEVAALRELLEHAPESPGRTAEGLLGWKTRFGNFICASCAARILGRGCSLPIGVRPVWDGPADDYPCSLTTGNVGHGAALAPAFFGGFGPVEAQQERWGITSASTDEELADIESRVEAFAIRESVKIVGLVSYLHWLRKQADDEQEGRA